MATKIRRLSWLIIFSMMVIAGAVGVGTAATTYTWFGGAGDWETAANWSPAQVPNNIANDYANVISSGGVGSSCNINSNISVVVPIFGIGYGLDINTPCTVNIKSGASLTTGSELIISIADNSYAVTNVYGTANLASLRMAATVNSKAQLNIDGGVVTVTSFGTYIGCDFYGANTNGNARINIRNNGTLTVKGTGLTGNRIDFGANGEINIEEGIFAVQGSYLSLLQGYINTAKIVSYNGIGTLSCYVSNGYTYVKTYNITPRVDAGPPIKRVWMTCSACPATDSLAGTVSDDGRPNPPGLVTLLWTVNKAPAGATVNFAPSAGVLNPAVTYDKQGTYVLRLTADDGASAVHDDIIVAVYPEDYVGLIAHWGFDEGSGSIAHDSIGGANGTLYGNPTWVAAGGKVGGCIDFDGLHNYINCGGGAGATWADLTYQMSISAWIKPRPSFGYRPAIIAKGNDAWGLQWSKDLNGIEFAAEGLSTDRIQTLSSCADLNDGRWHQIFATYDGSTAAIYVDGIQEANFPSGGLINTNDWDVWIGSNAQAVQDGNDCYFAGSIDEVKIYEIGLSPAKVLELYKAEGGSDSCVSYYIEGDINHDCAVNLEDFALWAQRYMQTSN